MKTKQWSVLTLPCLVLFLFLFASCTLLHTSDLPDLPDSSIISETDQRPIQQQCEKTYFQGHIQFVHSIMFELPTGQSATVIGVTVLDGETVKTALLSVEGFVLFDAELTKGSTLHVSRALAPFDNAAFASALMRDVTFIFQAPSDRDVSVAHLADDTIICRYHQDGGQITDILPTATSSRVNVYSSEGELIRSISTGGRIKVNGELIPGTVTLKVYGLRGYVLNMTLISADRITQENNENIIYEIQADLP